MKAFHKAPRLWCWNEIQPERRWFQYLRGISGHRYGDNTILIVLWTETVTEQFDFSVRRARVLLYAQINKDFLILTHIGLNSLNSNTMSPTGTGEGSQVFYMMLGLNTVLVKQCRRQVDYITGTEFRLNNQSTLNLMTLDNKGKLGLPWVYQINLRDT
jgi:hypothetical protein